MVKKKVLTGSWKTTVAGICMALSALLGEASNVLDDKPETKISIENIFIGLSGLLMGLNARDNDVTSKESGAE